MATNTPNYNLTKPDLEDFADIRVLNANMDIIDNNLNKLAHMITNVDNEDVQQKAPTLALVKLLLSSANIDVVKKLGEQTLSSLGVEYNLSDPNSWYIKLGQLFGNLIIQGGIKNNVTGWTHNKPVQVEFPIAFNSIININVTPVGQSSNTNLFYHFILVTNLDNQNFAMTADGTTVKSVYWIACGV